VHRQYKTEGAIVFPRRLSKSKIMAGLQCPKRLWLQTHRPELIQDDKSQQAYAAGNELGEAARRLYPEGQLIEHVFDIPKALAATQAALTEHPLIPLFEAAFQHEGVVVRVDLLFGEEDGLRLVEVKSTTSVKPLHITDSAIQAWVMENEGYQVKRVELAHVNNAFVYQGDGDYVGLLTHADITDAVSEIKPKVAGWASTFKTLLAGEMPDIASGEQCHKPYDCPFDGFCNKNQAEYPLTLLSYSRKFLEPLSAEGISDIRNVPESMLTTDKQRRIWSATMTGKPILDKAIADELAKLPYPRYYLDFETVGYVVPIWQGTRPYQSLPYQWSCHLETAPSTLTHMEYLDVDGTQAPMRRFAESLVAQMGADGPIFVYSSYEAGIIKGLIELHPDLAASLEKIIDRLVDLLPLAQKYYYHPAMKGSWSIKAVLPTIAEGAPDLDYKQLDEIQNGLLAQEAYLEIIRPDTSKERRDDLSRKMLVYCKLDTMAMVRLVEYFQS